MLLIYCQRYIFYPKANSNQALKQTGRAGAATKRFYLAGVFRGSMVSWLAPSGRLALRKRRTRRGRKKEKKDKDKSGGQTVEF